VNSGRRAVPAALAAFALTVVIGCGKQNGGVSDYDKMMAAKQNASTSLADSGVKTAEKQYPLGKAWTVDMRGRSITDDLLRKVKELGTVAEIDLSKSTVTDDHLHLMHELGLHTLLAKLDLSNTAVTDAGLQKLDGCVFLSELNLAGTKVTPGAVERFKKNRQTDPRVRIKNTTVRL
jgi:hypothetical protein